MNKSKTNLHVHGKLLGSVPIRRKIFQDDSFSPLLFVMALLPLTHILRELGMGYQLEKNGAKVKRIARGVVVVTTAQLHSTKPKLRFCAGSNPAHAVSEIRDGEDL